MPNKFEAWKQGLTIENLGKIANAISNCEVCPAFNMCKLTADRWCSTQIKEWGEQDAE